MSASPSPDTFLIDDQGKLVGGKLGKSSVRTLPLRHDGKMVKLLELLYPHVLFILISEEQIILVQRDHTVFSTDLQVFRYLEHFFEEQLLLKGLEVVIKPLTVKGQFWQVINSAEKIYSVRFKLEMPNFLGSTEAGLREALNIIKSNTNGTNLDIAVKKCRGDGVIDNKD